MVGDKNGVERRGLRFSGQIEIVLEVENFLLRRLRVTPGKALVTLGIEEEKVQDHRIIWHFLGSFGGDDFPGMAAISCR